MHVDDTLLKFDIGNFSSNIINIEKYFFKKCNVLARASVYDGNSNCCYISDILKRTLVTLKVTEYSAMHVGNTLLKFKKQILVVTFSMLENLLSKSLMFQQEMVFMVLLYIREIWMKGRLSYL